MRRYAPDEVTVEIGAHTKKKLEMKEDESSDESLVMRSCSTLLTIVDG
jgi:hypothetical protein